MLPKAAAIFDGKDTIIKLYSQGRLHHPTSSLSRCPLGCRCILHFLKLTRSTSGAAKFIFTASPFRSISMASAWVYEYERQREENPPTAYQGTMRPTPPCLYRPNTPRCYPHPLCRWRVLLTSRRRWCNACQRARNYYLLCPRRQYSSRRHLRELRARPGSERQHSSITIDE